MKNLNKKLLSTRFAFLIAVCISLTLTFSACSSPENTKTAEANQSQSTSNESTKNSISNDTDNKSKSEDLLSESKVHFINTGNSDAILITGSKNILIDGGDNDDEKSLVKYIKDQGVKSLDYMIATHPHADHIGALDAVLKAFKVNNLLVANGSSTSDTYTDFINAAANKKVSPSVPLEGRKFELNYNSYIQIFNTNGGSDANEESLVALYVNGNDKFLFTGDAEKGTEKEILSKMIDVDVLKVSHHGSRTSTTSEFLNKVNPEYAVLTVGKDNKYNHPHKETMDKLKNKNIKVHRTDECGNVIFTSTGSGVKTDCSSGSYSYKDNSKDKVKETPKDNTEKQPEKSKPKKKSEPSKQNTNVSKVWLSETGSKYHSINNCGRMNPNNATQVTLSEAQKSYDACSKCN
ncbi:MAG: ComEC/Rec2 family competence protein [Clostridium sp.]|uniref:ComEC/Rec2 family competence protein n=1 Tax=Clostridium sp. TaxID=1506 RepID=UPI003F322702